MGCPIGKSKHGRFNLRSDSWWLNFDPYQYGCASGGASDPAPEGRQEHGGRVRHTAGPPFFRFGTSFPWKTISSFRRNPVTHVRFLRCLDLSLAVFVIHIPLVDHFEQGRRQSRVCFDMSLGLNWKPAILACPGSIDRSINTCERP